MNFQPKDPNFPNPSFNQNSKVSFSNSQNGIETLNHWLEKTGKQNQSRSFSLERIKKAYENYLCESSKESTSYLETLTKPKKQAHVKAIVHSIIPKGHVANEKLKFGSSMSDKYVFSSQSFEFDLIE